jgi:sugar lactone lactonase YvrE
VQEFVNTSTPRDHQHTQRRVSRTATTAILAFARVLSLLLVGEVAHASSAAVTSFSGATKVGNQSGPQPIVIRFDRQGTVSSIQVVTQGVVGADFSDSHGGTCLVGQSYAAGQQCSVNVTFKPLYPGQRFGAVLVTGTDSTVLGTSLITAAAMGSLSVIVPGRIDTVAGNGAWIFRGDGSTATSSPIFLPMGEVVDPAGNLYLSDSNNNRVRKVDVRTGLVSTIAGTGNPGFSGDGGLASNAMVSSPAGLLLDGGGNLYFADCANHAVRRVDAVSGIITTVAGSGGVQGYGGDGGGATVATLSFPEGIAFDPSQNLLIADTGNSVIRKVDASTGAITTVAGTGSAGFNGDGKQAVTAQLNGPWSVATASDGSFYIADLTNNRVRRVDTNGSIATVAGTGNRSFTGDGAAAIAAALNAPASVVLDPARNLYIADSGNNRVRKVSAVTGVIQTIVGGNSEQFDGDTGPANLASLYGPYSLFLDGSGNLYISDMFHNRIREVSSSSIALQYATIRVSKTSPPQPEALENDGNIDLTLASIALDNSALDPATTTCAVGALSPSGVCTLGVEFAPTVVGDQVAGSVQLKSDAGNSPGIISVSGKVLMVEPTTVTLTSTANPSLVGTTILLNASVSSADSSRSGTVVFTDGATQLCSTSLNANGNTVCQVASLSLGQHSIVASYSGDPNNASSVSAVLMETIKQPSTLVLVSSPNPSTVTGAVGLTVTASAPQGTPTGPIVFLDNGTALGSMTLSSSGLANLSTSALSVGTHTLTVEYDGDASDAATQSNAVQQVVVHASTNTTLTSNNETADVGTNVVLTVVVSSKGGPAPSGTVSFMEGATSLGTASVDGSGIASVTLSSLAPGAHPITAVYGGDTNNATSTSAILTQQVQQLRTAANLVADANPANAGAALHLTATLAAIAKASPTVGPIDGLVTFQDGTVSIGAAKVNTNGVAAISVAALSVGQHTITAVYQGNVNYSPSTSDPLSEAIKQSSTTTLLASTATSSIAGNPVTIVATVSSVGGTATGSVLFRDGDRTLGQSTLDGQGKTTLTLSNLSVGTHLITATYAGDSNYLTSASNPLQQAVVIASTAITLSGSSNTIDAGLTLVLTSTLTSNGGRATGSVTVKDGAAVVGTQAVSGSGAFTFTESGLSVGSHTFIASYSGDANDASIVSTPLVVVVQPAATSVALQSSENPLVLNQPLTLLASVASSSKGMTGGIAFRDGSTVLGLIPLNAAGTATFTTAALSIGSHNLTATYSGDPIHVTATSSALTEQVVQAAALSVSSTANPSVAGVPVSFTAKVFGTAPIFPTGTVSFLDGSTVLGTAQLDGTGSATFQTAALTVGQHSVTVSYAGDKAYQAVNSNVLFQIVKSADTQVVLIGLGGPATYKSDLVLRAIVTGNGGTPKGTVTFEEGGVVLGRGNLDAGGVATISTATLSPGMHALVANYGGDNNDSTATSPALTQQVQQITTTSLGSSLNPSPTLSPLVLTAAVNNGTSVSPTGVIRFTDGATVLGTVPLEADGVAALTVPLLSAGNHSLQATYIGDIADFVSVAPQLTEVVVLRPTTNALTATAAGVDGGKEETLIAVLRWTGPVAPTGTMTFETGGSVIGTATVDRTGVATLTVVLNSSTEDVSASYGGDVVYAGSDSPIATISSGPATQFTIQVNPATLTLQSKQHSTIDVTLSSVKGFSDTLALGCLGLPFAATCTFSQDVVQLSADGKVVVHVVVDTGSPLTAGGQAQARTKSPFAVSPATLCSLPGALLAALLLRKRKGLHIPSLLLTLIIASFAMELTGCGAIQINGTPPGTYAVKVSAAGKQTGITQTQDITVAVTQ